MNRTSSSASVATLVAFGFLGLSCHDANNSGTDEVMAGGYIGRIEKAAADSVEGPTVSGLSKDRPCPV